MNEVQTQSKLEIIGSYDFMNKTIDIYGTVDNPLFLAKEVAEWIEHTNVVSMIQSVDEEEKVKVNNVYVANRTGGNGTWLLTEDGLYEVFMQSRKPIAKQFKKKIKEILKDIRKTGSYNSPTISPQTQELRDKTEYVRQLNHLIDRYGGNTASVDVLLGLGNTNISKTATPRKTTENTENVDDMPTNEIFVKPLYDVDFNEGDNKYETVDKFIRGRKIPDGITTTEVYSDYVAYYLMIHKKPRTRQAFIRRLTQTTRLNVVALNKGK